MMDAIREQSLAQSSLGQVRIRRHSLHLMMDAIREQSLAQSSLGQVRIRRHSLHRRWQPRGDDVRCLHSTRQRAHMQAHITFASRRLEHWLKHRPKPLARERRLLPAKWREDLSLVDCFERRTTLLILLETHLMREAIMGHPWSSVVISGHQRPSELLEAHL
jgi:hypothetical protein